MFGSSLWVIRSNHRRQDKQSNKSASMLLNNFSKKLYELRPFICVLIALLSTKFINISWIKGPSVILLIVSLWILTLRVANRHLSTSNVKKYTAS